MWIEDQDLFKEHWEELVESHIEPTRRLYASQGKKRPRAPDLSKVQSFLLTGQLAGSRKYSKPRPDKKTWEAEDHFARFLHQVRSVNLDDRNGIFYNKGWSDSEIDQRIWLVYLRQSDKYSAQIKRTDSASRMPTQVAYEPKPTSQRKPTSEADPMSGINPEPTVEPEPTVDPRPTVEPMAGLDPEPTVKPTSAVDPQPTVEPMAGGEPMAGVEPTSENDATNEAVQESDSTVIGDPLSPSIKALHVHPSQIQFQSLTLDATAIEPLDETFSAPPDETSSATPTRPKSLPPPDVSFRLLRDGLEEELFVPSKDGLEELFVSSGGEADQGNTGGDDIGPSIEDNVDK